MKCDSRLSRVKHITPTTYSSFGMKFIDWIPEKSVVILNAVLSEAALQKQEKCFWRFVFWLQKIHFMKL